MDIPKKRGRWSSGEESIIIDGIRSNKDPEDILFLLTKNDPKGRSRELPTVKRKMNKLKVKHGIEKEFEAKDDDRIILRSKPFYTQLKKQYTSDEIKLFEDKWIELMKQFEKEEVLPSEEIQLKELINIGIFINRHNIEKKEHIEEGNRIQILIDGEYEKPIDNRDTDRIDMLTQQKTIITASATSFITEYDKLLKHQTAILKDLKANREARVQKIESSKDNWASVLVMLEQIKERERLGEEVGLMCVAKEKAKHDMSQWHTYDDGMIDQPFLTPETVMGEDYDKEEVGSKEEIS